MVGCVVADSDGKRIFRTLGNEVKDLERISIGSLKLPENLTPGQWRNMTEEEKNSVIE